MSTWNGCSPLIMSCYRTGDEPLLRLAPRLSTPDDAASRLQARARTERGGRASVTVATIHSWRSATIGSMRDARHAGAYPAATAATASIATDSDMASGSLAFMPNRKEGQRPAGH